MKILHVETGRHFLGGPQQVVYLINALRALGHENTLVCPPGSGVDGAARLAGIRVQNLFCAGDLDLPFAYRLSQFLKEYLPDIVHCHSRRGADLLGGLAASLAEIPAIVSRRVDNTEMRLMAALRYKSFEKIVAISDAVAGVLRDQDVDADKIVVIRDAVDADAFPENPDRAAMRDEFNLDDNHFAIAAAGQLIPRKGHRYLLQAVAELVQRRPQVRLVIFGEGALNDELRVQASELGLGGVVQFAGFRPDIDEYIAGFDLFVHPALTEGLGVATLKAASAGLAVVGFDAGGVKEAVAHRETGLVVPAEDVEKLHDAMAMLIDDESTRLRMGAAGRSRMQSEFSIDTMAEKHVALYAEVINGVTSNG